MSGSGSRADYNSVVSLSDARAGMAEKQEQLSDSEIEYRWAVATEFYPDIKPLREQIGKLSGKLSYEFVVLVVQQRKFRSADKIAVDLVTEYLADLCDSNDELVDYGFNLYKSGSREELYSFVELCSVFGGEISRVKIEEFIESRVIRVFSPEAKPFEVVVEAVASDINHISLANITDQQANVDVLTDLKRTMLGRFYLNNIKTRPRLRMFALALWKKICPLYFFVKKTNLFSDWYPLEKFSEYVRRKSVESCELIEKCEIKVARPVVFPETKSAEVTVSAATREFPPVYVARIERGRVVGGTNLVRGEGSVICHDLYDFKRDYTSEEMHGRNRLSLNKKKVAMRVLGRDATHLDVAATFVDAVSVNYAHWVTEVLPRILAFCTDEKFSDVPVIVNDGLHENIMESLFLAAGRKRQIITLPVCKQISVDNLYVTSVAGYVPFEPRGKRKLGDSDGIFSAFALERLRHYMHKYVIDIGNISWPEKVYLRRHSGARNIINADEVERAMVDRGYEVVDCATLTFLQQVCLFAHANVVVGASGAAFANAVFSKPGTRACIIISSHVDMVYGYWCNVLSPIGIKVNYLLGEIGENQDYGVHSDFSVDMQALEDMLRALER